MTAARSTLDLPALLTAKLKAARPKITAKRLALSVGLNEHAVSDILKGKVDSPGIRTLDRIAAGLGYESYVHMVTDRPALDEALLADAIELALHFGHDGEQPWPAAWISKATILIYRAHSDPTRTTPPDSMELAALIVREFGLRPAADKPAGARGLAQRG